MEKHEKMAWMLRTFLEAEKLVKEMKRYRQINQSGVQIVGFGQGDIPEEDTPVLEQWVDLPQNTRALENQWYLVATLPTPMKILLDSTNIPVLGYKEGGNVWLCTSASGIRAHPKGMTPAPHVSGPESFRSPVRGDNSPDVGEIHPLFP
jgi:hypothetical protein